MTDPGTARVALKLQLDHVDAILMSLPPPPSKDAPAADQVVAFRVLREELLRTWHEVNGRCLAHNVLREERSNCIVFTRLLSEEQQAECDHDLACRLAGVPVPLRASVQTQRPRDEAERQTMAIDRAEAETDVPRVDLGVARTVAALATPSRQLKRVAPNQLTSGVGKRAATHSAMAGQQATVEAALIDPERLKPYEPGGGASLGLQDTALTGSGPRVTPSVAQADDTDAIKKGTCASCLDLHPRHDMLQLDCRDEGDRENHAYCRDCHRRLFESSVTDPSHFPPRCCSKIISLFSCTPFLPQPLVARFVTRREELGTPNRTYCSNSKCSRWIHLAKIVANVASCSDCPQKTCATCKAKHHNGLCPEDEAVKDLLNVTRQKRWQTCSNCKEMVELERGCYHITCRCRHEFCYLCVGKWKTCKCPTWDERNIIDAPQPAAVEAAAIAAPIENPPPAANPLPAPVVPRAAAPRMDLFAPHTPSVNCVATRTAGSTVALSVESRSAGTVRSIVSERGEKSACEKIYLYSGST